MPTNTIGCSDDTSVIFDQSAATTTALQEFQKKTNLQLMEFKAEVASDQVKQERINTQHHRRQAEIETRLNKHMHDSLKALNEVNDKIYVIGKKVQTITEDVRSTKRELARTKQKLETLNSRFIMFALVETAVLVGVIVVINYLVGKV